LSSKLNVRFDGSGWRKSYYRYLKKVVDETGKEMGSEYLKLKNAGISKKFKFYKSTSRFFTIDDSAGL
jgi:hypothetical protein